MKRILIASLLVLTLLLGACAPAAIPAEEAAPAEEEAEPEEETAPEETVKAEDIKIGYIVKTLGNPTWQGYAEGARDAAEDLGVQLDVRDVPTEDDIEGQLNLALSMVNQDYDAIVAASITNSNLIPAIAAANEKGIPWIVVSEDQDQDILDQNNAYVTAKVRLSFYLEGVTIGNYVAEQLNGEGQVGIVEGMAGTSATRDRVQGIKDAFEEYPDIEIVASQPGDWDRELAREVTAVMLEANPDIDAIIANNDTMALGALVAVEQAGKQDEVIVTGDDGINDAYESIKDGGLDATVDGVVWQIAYYSVHAAVKAVAENKDTLESMELYPNLVTIDNVDETISTYPVPPENMFEVNKNIYLPIEGITE